MRTVDPAKHLIQRQVILSAARACFARHGFHKTSTDAICAEAGTSSGKLFHYFSSKKEIFLAVVEQQHQQTAVWLESLQQRSDVSFALSEVLDTVLHLAGDAGERQLILEMAAEGARDPDVAAANAAGDRRLAQGLTALLDAAVADGQARPAVPNDHAVRFLMALIDGIFSRVAVDSAFAPEAERAALQTIVHVVMGTRGVQADG